MSDTPTLDLLYERALMLDDGEPLRVTHEEWDAARLDTNIIPYLTYPLTGKVKEEFCGHPVEIVE